MTLTGMDTARGHDLAAVLSAASDRLLELEDSLGSRVRSTVGARWTGDDAAVHLARWTDQLVPRLEEARSVLDVLELALRGHAAEQDLTSAPRAAPDGPFQQRLEILGADWTDISGAEIWQNLKENVGIDAADAAGGLVTGTHTFAEVMTERSFGARVMPGFVPVIGDVFTGALAGVDRWNVDAGRTDLDTGERLGRAVIDGMANFGGSIVGGTVAGGALAAVGTALGGGGGATAGAAAGVAPAVPGAVGGSFAGAVTGQIVGDVVGSYAGATAADAVIDSFLN